MPKWKIVSSRSPRYLSHISNKDAVWFDAGIIKSVAGVPFDQIPLCYFQKHSTGGSVFASLGLNSTGGKVAIESDGSCWLACRSGVTEDDFEWIEG